MHIFQGIWPRKTPTADRWSTNFMYWNGTFSAAAGLLRRTGIINAAQSRNLFMCTCVTERRNSIYRSRCRRMNINSGYIACILCSEVPASPIDPYKNKRNVFILNWVVKTIWYYKSFTLHVNLWNLWLDRFLFSNLHTIGFD